MLILVLIIMLILFHPYNFRNHFLDQTKNNETAVGPEPVQIYQCLSCQFFTTSTTVIVEHQRDCSSKNNDVPVSMISTSSVSLCNNLSAILPESTEICTNASVSSTNSQINSINLPRTSAQLLTPTDCAAMFTISENGVKTYTCPHCPHATNRAHALSKHINSMHTKAVWFHCDYCQYRSTDRSCLRRHIRNLHVQKGLVSHLTCDQCGYQCSSEHNLQRHLLKHESGVLQCPFCSYSSKDRSNFRKHLFVHNQTEYSCRFCKYACYSPYQLKLHLKNKHNSAGIDDVDCRSETPLDMLVDEISVSINRTGSSFVGNDMQ